MTIHPMILKPWFLGGDKNKIYVYTIHKYINKIISDNMNVLKIRMWLRK
jgi:hypothetical protein